MLLLKNKKPNQTKQKPQQKIPRKPNGKAARVDDTAGKRWRGGAARPPGEEEQEEQENIWSRPLNI